MCLYKNPRGQKSKELSKRAFQQVRTYGRLRFKGIVSDHGSTALAATYIGYGFKNPTNLGLPKAQPICPSICQLPPMGVPPPPTGPFILHGLYIIISDEYNPGMFCCG